MEFETIIGLEVHVQLATNSKIFCSASAEFGGQPNQYVDAVTLGLPGCLPVVNKKVIEYAIMLGIATHCEIRRFNRFARKHYFYPDLPKGYQISQFDEPICERGHIEIMLDNAKRTIGLKRIHMEEDAGKNLHDPRTQSSLIDLNRAGVPLLEVVSDPDIRSPAEAAEYLRKVRQLVRFLGISDGNMDEGSLRCDANISLRPVGQLKFGTRTEIKNINSFKFVERALEYEIARQMQILKSGGDIIQETLLFDSATGTTHSMRSKEESSDYRYLPDPDLPPVIVEEGWIREIKDSMPKLPHELAQELMSVHGLTAYDVNVLTTDRPVLHFFNEVLAVCGNAKAACNWLTSELFGLLNKNNVELAATPISAQNLGELISLLDKEVINGKMAKAVFEEMFATGKSAQEIVAEKGLKQITSEDEILKIVQNIFDANPSQVAGFLAGKQNLQGFFVGQVMKASGGQANPKLVNVAIAREAETRKSKL